MNKKKQTRNSKLPTTPKDNVKRTSLKSDLAEFLWAIWKITGEVSEVADSHLATNESLSKMLGLTESVIRQRFTQTKQLDLEYVETFDIIEDDKEQGRNRFGYYLSPSLVTLPRTAILILELLEYKNSEPHQISRNNFIQFLMGKYEWDKSFIEGRIGASEKHGYIIGLTDEFIWRGIRCYREFKFIEIIAKEAPSEYSKFKGENYG